ncbi:hypothetical protein FQZ97_1201260 [compost metagenome]
MRLDHLCRNFSSAVVELELRAQGIAHIETELALQQLLHDLDPRAPGERLPTAFRRLVDNSVEVTGGVYVVARDHPHPVMRIKPQRQDVIDELPQQRQGNFQRV